MNDSTEMFIDDKFILHRVKFSIILLLELSAIAISLVIFVFFMKRRDILRAPQYHILSILLLTNFIQLVIDIPFPLHFYSSGYVNPANPTFCSWWTYIEFTLYATNEYLVAIMSIQRHLLIFKGHIMRIRWKHIMLCNLPIAICLIYPITFYTFAIMLYQCDGEDPWDYTNNVCGYTGCYLKYNKFLGTYDWVVNNGFPMVVDALANVILIIRVIVKKHSNQRAASWRQHRNMVKQLFGVSSLFIIGWTPSLIVGLIQIFVDPNFLAEINSDYFLDLCYIPCLFLPWMCIGLIPELKKWIRLSRQRRQPRNMVGAIAVTNHMATRTRI